MSKLYMSHRSDARAEVTRRAHHGMTTHLRGWDDGVRVISNRLTDGRVSFQVYRTNGSNDPGTSQLVAAWIEGEPVLLVETEYAITSHAHERQRMLSEQQAEADKPTERAEAYALTMLGN